MMTPGLSEDSQYGLWSSKDTLLKKKKEKLKLTYVLDVQSFTPNALVIF